MSEEFKAIKDLLLDMEEEVESTNVAVIGYSEAYQVIQTEFNSGRVYQAFPCSREMFERYQQATSKGKFYNQFIKDVEGITVKEVM